MQDNTNTISLPTPSQASARAQSVPEKVSFAIGSALLIGVVLLDIYVPFNRPWSNLYFLVAVYVGLFLRGRTEIVLYGIVIVSALLVPALLRPERVGLENVLLNRITGVVFGLIIVGLLWGRRVYVEALHKANQELEARVMARTSELQFANRALQREITERERAQEAVQTSRERLEVLSRELITTLESERRHIARELHDEIGQILTAIKMNLRRAQGAPDAGLQAILAENCQMVDHAIVQTRNLSLSLRPPQLDELGLVAALHWLIRQQGQSGEFEGRLDADLTDVEISPDLEIVCFRIVQEALTNAVRHARPTTLVVKLWAQKDQSQKGQLRLSVHDDGIGFNVGESRQLAQKGGSVGLISMKERASLIGGHLEIESSSSHGTTIRASFPLSTGAESPISLKIATSSWNALSEP